MPVSEEFQFFINLVWPWFVGGFIINVIVWKIGAGLRWLGIAIG